MPRVVFTPSGHGGNVAVGTSVLDAARRLGADLDTVCAGRGICGRCQIAQSTGTFAKWAITSAPGALSAPGSLELDYHGARPLDPGHRLGCAALITGDVVIDVPAASQVHRQVVRKDLDLPALIVDPTFTLHYVDLAGVGAGTAVDRLVAALGEQHGITIDAAAVHPAVLRRIQPTSKDGAVTVAARDGTLVAVWPGYADRAVGVAIDVGSTTIAGHLCDLTTGEVLASAGRMNPQIRFGEDLMSRVSYVMMNRGGETELTAAVREALAGLVDELLAAAAAGRDELLEVVVVGNPIMHHLVLGIDPTPLGQAPFELATDRATAGPASELGIDAPFAAFYAGPCIAGHVGADAAAALLAEGPHRGDTWQLLVDVGTNAEIVLGNRHRQLAASSPTGPAFEGAQVSCGQRATAGAIERVRIDATTLEPRFKVIGAEPWSDEPGFAAAIAHTGITGICGSGIIDAVAEMYLARIVDADGAIDGANAARTRRVEPTGRTFRYVLSAGEPAVAITQNDVRAIQLAKAALRAGIELLLEHAGNPPVTDIRLAGAFGAHIDPLHAMVIGLVPDCRLDRVRSVGNAAGAGAVLALLSGERRREMEAAVRAVEKIETATEPRFQEHFVQALTFPHGTAPSPNLAQLVPLPARRDRSTRRRR